MHNRRNNDDDDGILGNQFVITCDNISTLNVKFNAIYVLEISIDTHVSPLRKKFQDVRFCLANPTTFRQPLSRSKIKNFGSKSKIEGLPILWGVGGLCGGVVLLLGDLTEFTVVSNLGLLGSKVTKGIFVSVWENLSFVSEGIRDHMGILNKELMNCVFRDVSEKNDDVVTLSSLL